MAFSTSASCINCYACETVCPNNAIRMTKPHFEINPRLCNECEGQYAVAQCTSICPVEGAILDANGEPLNPLGSLAGVSPQRSVAATEQPRASVGPRND